MRTPLTPMSKAVPCLVGGVPQNSNPVALLLPGGQVNGHFPPDPLACALMTPFAWSLHRRGICVRLLRYRFNGWNGDDCDPVRDIEWALNRLRPRPIFLVGHSMGGRAALWSGGDLTVAGVVALAPWLEPVDPWEQLRETPTLIAHGIRDRVTNPQRSRRFADAAGARFISIDDGHTMTHRMSQWVAIVRQFVMSHA